MKISFQTSFLALVSALGVFALPGLVHASDIVRDFAAQASFDGRNLTVQEKIDYDFGTEFKHGIFRYIPEYYSRSGANYRLRLKVLDVERDGRAEDYSKSQSQGNFQVKIGDKDVTITGTHVYTLKYSTDRAINFFPDHDELYWNVTGNDWPGVMEKVSFRLALPNGQAYTDAKCFTGAFGSTEEACTIRQAGSEAVVETRRVLEPGENLTVVFAFPVGTFPKPTSAEKVMMVIWDNGALAFPLAALVIMYLIWRSRGKDPLLGSIIPEYDPPRAWPAALQAAAATDGEVPNRAVTATILDLARRGYLNIRFGEEKGLFSKKQTFTFVQKNPADDKLTDFETKLLEGLFAGGPEQDLDSLKKSKFYTTVQSFKSKVQAKIDASGVFEANPLKVRSAYMAVGVFVGFILFLWLQSTLLGAACAIATGVIILIFGVFMPRRTVEGVKLLADIRGFKWFLSVTEKDRLDFHNAPERTPEQFMALLPFAIAFGVEKKWADQFASLTIPPPEWAQGNVSGFNTVLLASALSDLNTNATSTAFSPPSQAGGGGSGFSGGGSGGGFGGGGGGSW